jgi:hypothetical protein
VCGSQKALFCNTGRATSWDVAESDVFSTSSSLLRNVHSFTHRPIHWPQPSSVLIWTAAAQAAAVSVQENHS